MKKNIGYIRCSTDAQDTAHQRASIISFAKSLGVEIDEWYEEYISAFQTEIEEREEIQKVRQVIKNGEVQSLFLFEPSRIARKQLDQLTFIELCTSCNCKIYSVKDNKCINQENIDRLYNSIKSYFDEEASRTTSARVKSAKKLQRERGEFQGGRLPFGFKTENKKAIVDEELRDIVIRAYEIYLQKNSQVTIEYLSQYTDRYKNNQTLLQWLENPKMKEIVGEDLYYKFTVAREERNQHKNTHVKTNRSPQLLEGLLFHDCEECNGGKLSVDYNRGKLVYKCRKCKSLKTKVKKSWQGEKLTANIEAEVLEVLNELDREKLIKKYEEENATNIKIINNQIKHYEENIKHKDKELAKAQENLQKLIVSNLDVNTIEMVSNTIKSMEKALEELREDYEEQKKQLALEEIKFRNQAKLVDQLLDFKYLYSKGTQEQKKNILQNIIDKVLVKDIEDFKVYLKF